MDRRVFLIALAPLAFGTGAFGFTGLLEVIAADLQVTIGEAGQIAAVLAVTVAMAAPVLAAAVGGMERRRLLTGALFLFAAACAACALAPDYPGLLLFRVAAGLAGALIGPMASTLGASLAPPDQRGTALAVIFGGTALSFLLGVPLSAVVGDALGWRAAFWLAAGFAAAVGLLLRAVLPRAEAPPVQGGLKAFRLAAQPAVAPWLLSTLLIFMATQVTVAYIAPVARVAAGLTGGAVGGVQAFIGVGSLIGLVVGGRIAGRGGRGLPAFFAVVVATQLGYSLLLLRADPSPLALAALALVVLIGAGALFGSVPVLQARLMAAAGPAAPFALALNASMIFLGQGLGAALGGLVVDAAALTWVGVTGAGVAIAGLALSAASESGHGVSGRRPAAPAAG